MYFANHMFRVLIRIEHLGYCNKYPKHVFFIEKWKKKIFHLSLLLLCVGGWVMLRENGSLGMWNEWRLFSLCKCSSHYSLHFLPCGQLRIQGSIEFSTGWMWRLIWAISSFYWMIMELWAEKPLKEVCGDQHWLFSLLKHRPVYPHFTGKYL